jgi:pyruvate/2-oxoglutarate/acetoin dehydrogenase E1 component
MTAATARLNGSQIVARTLRAEMARDPSIIVMGEDVAQLGGVFGATRGLLSRFGADRVLDTPISETAFVGAAIGAAQSGLRPVVEIMFVDFIGVCFDQLINEMAKHRYMSGGEQTTGLVVRTAGGCIGAAGQHSQILSATLAHVPGLKVVLPATLRDLQGLLTAALRDPDPVVIIEHKLLLKATAGTLAFGAPAEDLDMPEPIEIGRLQRVRDGEDLTIVASGFMSQLAFEAAVELERSTGRSVGVVDLRTISPLDRAGLLREALAAPRMLVVDEDYGAFGVCSEVIAVVAEGLGRHAPLMARLAPSSPVPASARLESAVVPSAVSIAERAAQLLA